MNTDMRQNPKFSGEVKAILIDVDNTLLDFQACSVMSIKEGLKTIGVPYHDNILQVFYKINNEYWSRYEKGEIEKKDILENRWKNVFKELGIQEDGVAFEALFVEGIARSHEPVKDALEVLKYLSTKYPVYVASNAQYKQQIGRLAAAGMLVYIQKVFVSDVFGAAKPSAEFFEACLQEIDDVNPKDVIMIGDSLSADILGGKNAGIQTCWYNHHGKENKTDIQPDYQIDELKELYKIL